MSGKYNTDKTHDKKSEDYLEPDRVILIRETSFQGSIRNKKREFCRLIGGSKLPQKYD